MTIDSEKQAAILRLHYVEKWPVGTIARHLNVHHGVVKRVLSTAGVSCATLCPRPSALDNYLPFILDTLKIYPLLSASRLYEMVRSRGYPRGPDHFRHLIALHRPRPASEAYLRLRTLPGEQAQVDWGLCRARHNPHYADHYAMPSCDLKFLIFSAIQQNIA